MIKTDLTLININKGKFSLIINNYTVLD